VFNPPAARIVTESLERQHWSSKRCIALVERNRHARVPEPDDVQAPIAINVGQHARMAVNPPAVILTKMVDGLCRIGKYSVSLVERNPHARIAEPDDILEAIAVQIAKQTRMAVNPPTPSIVPIVLDR
jgi:hypothetical protein